MQKSFKFEFFVGGWVVVDWRGQTPKLPGALAGEGALQELSNIFKK